MITLIREEEEFFQGISSHICMKIFMSLSVNAIENLPVYVPMMLTRSSFDSLCVSTVDVFNELIDR
jgi:hypothetical protein